MRVLIDEDLPHKLRMHVPGHEAATVDYMGWGGLKNGELLKTAEDAGFDVLLTGDQSMPYEQNLSGRKLAIVTLSAIEWPIIREHLGKIAAAVDAAAPSSFTSVDCGSFARRTKPLR
jgi:alkanesulfonate monooxygenase SsuD/methylene tetrahydromethanopterin reductase-like flavin-dependent oxidoreductase (luciferase family)